VGTEAASAPATLRSSPNPFADQVHIDFGEVIAADGLLQLYDLQGRLVAERQVAAGRRAVDWSLLPTANGTYWLRLQADGATRSIIVARLKN
jgi:Secretion system C-terminal sorting domain